jgi:WD40 repeat protein
VHAARRDLESQQRTSEPSRAAATLAAVVSQSGWRLLLRGHESGVQSAAFSPDGARIVTASYDTTARIWDAATGKEITVLRGHENGVWSPAFSPDGARIVTASSDKTARIWDAATGKEITVLRGHQDSVRSAAFSPDGSRIVTASSDKTARIWDAATGKEITVLRGHENRLYAESLFCSFEQLRMGDTLVFAEQACRSGRRLEFGHT